MKTVEHYNTNFSITCYIWCWIRACGSCQSRKPIDTTIEAEGILPKLYKERLVEKISVDNGWEYFQLQAHTCFWLQIFFFHTFSLSFYWGWGVMAEGGVCVCLGRGGGGANQVKGYKKERYTNLIIMSLTYAPSDVRWAMQLGFINPTKHSTVLRFDMLQQDLRHGRN